MDNNNSTQYIWVLREMISGEPFTSTNIEPKDIESPVEWDFTHAYWSKEKVIKSN